MNGVGENAGITIGMADDLQLIRKRNPVSDILRKSHSNRS